jgi:hypothetical protein
MKCFACGLIMLLGSVGSLWLTESGRFSEIEGSKAQRIFGGAPLCWVDWTSPCDPSDEITDCVKTPCVPIGGLFKCDEDWQLKQRQASFDNVKGVPFGGRRDPRPKGMEINCSDIDVCDKGKTCLPDAFGAFFCASLGVVPGNPVQPTEADPTSAVCENNALPTLLLSDLSGLR